jgi:putative ABC transport system permease protein
VDPVLDSLLHDLRFALRTLRTRRAYAAIAILTIALGIGAATAIFSVVDAVLLRPLPFPSADRIVMLWGTLGGQRQEPVMIAHADVMDWRERSRSFESIGIMRGMSVNLTGTETPDQLSGMFASAETFDILGAKTAIGRTFTADEALPRAGARVVVLGHSTWQSRFGGDPRILGRSLVLNGQPHAVIGVLTPDFYTPLGGSGVWLPISSIPWKGTFDRGNQNVWAVGRLRAGITVDAARRDLDAIMADLARVHPATNAGAGAAVIPLRDQIVGALRGSLLTIFAAVGVLLLIACANVANLQLARGASRVHELALRTALGAPRRRIIRQLLTESALLAAAGGVLGVLIALWTLRLVSLVPGRLPSAEPVAVNGAVLFFALGVSVLSAIVFGLAPAIRSSRSDPRAALNVRADTGDRGWLRGGAAITVAQLALCTALLIVAGLLTRSLSRLRAVDPGFDASEVLTAEFRLPLTKYGPEPKRAAFFERALAELRSMPGAVDASLSSSLPLSGNFGLNGYEVDGRAADRGDVQARAYVGLASEGYFRTLGIALLAGRDFSPDDRQGTQRVMIVNETLARRAWPRQSPLGRTIRVAGDQEWATVIGVVADSKEIDLAEPQGARLYGALMQDPGVVVSVAVRTRGSPGRYTEALRRSIWAVDRDQPVWGIRPLSDHVSLATSRQRFTTALTVTFAGLALLLGAIGVYGVMSYAVARRTREMGVRLALGATGRGLVSLVVGSVLRLSLIGAAAGIAIGAALGQALDAQLFGITPYDPLTFASVPLVLLAVALLAAYAPARRASRVDPMVALRSD